VTTDYDDGNLPAQGALRRSLTDIVADRLSRFITESQMKAGDALPSEARLSETFGASKRVVREALRALAAQGCIETSQGKLAVVAETRPVAVEAYFKYVQRLDRSSVLELYEFREIIEVRATALAATRATRQEIQQARLALSEMENAGDDVDAYVTGDLAFHTAIINAAHNRFLSAMVGALSEALREEREMGVRDRRKGKHSPRAIQEHRAILKALEEKDSHEAERRIIAHLKSGLRDFRPAPGEAGERSAKKPARVTAPRSGSRQDSSA